MNRTIVSSLIIFTLLFSISAAHAAHTRSKAYRLSVTIPATVSFTKAVKVADQEILVTTSRHQDVTIERVVRNNVPILLESMTVK